MDPDPNNIETAACADETSMLHFIHNVLTCHPVISGLTQRLDTVAIRPNAILAIGIVGLGIIVIACAGMARKAGWRWSANSESQNRCLLSLEQRVYMRRIQSKNVKDMFAASRKAEEGLHKDSGD